MSTGGPKSGLVLILPLSPAVRTGLEPATPGVTGLYSNRLNYRTRFKERLSFNSGANVRCFFESSNICENKSGKSCGGLEAEGESGGAGGFF